MLRPGDYQRVFQQSTRLSGRYLTVLVRPAAGSPAPARLGLAVSKKQLKRAVDRNRAKRLIRESFRHHRSLLAGLDIVVMVRHPIAYRSNAEILEALQSIWRQAASTLNSAPS